MGSGNRLVPISPVEMDGSSWSVVPPVSRARTNRRGMQPAGGIRPCPPRVKNEHKDGEGKTHAIPLLVEAEKCTFMQTEVGFLGHIVGRTGLACDPAKLSAVRNRHAPDKVKALTRKGAPFVWTDRQQTAFNALKACLISAPILGFPTEDGRFLLDTDTNLFAVGEF